MITNNDLRYYKIEPKDKSVIIKRVVEEEYYSTTGEIINTREYKKYKKTSRKGWAKMYPIDFSEAVMSLKNKTSVDLYMWFIHNKMFKQDGSIKQFKQLDVAKEMNISRQAVSRALKDLQHNRLVDKIDGEWRYNPFIFLPSNTKDEDALQSQYIWEKELGHYTKQINSKTNKK